MRPYAGTTPSKATIYAYSNLRRKPGIDASKPARYWPAMESPSKAGRAVCVRTLLSLSNAIVGWRSPDSSRNSASKQKSMLQQTEIGRASAMVKRISNVKRRDIPQAAIDAWRRGDAEGLRAALHLPPWEFNPLPYGRAVGYGLLPAEEPTPTGTAMVESWPKNKALQDQLYRRRTRSRRLRICGRRLTQGRFACGAAEG